MIAAAAAAAAAVDAMNQISSWVLQHFNQQYKMAEQSVFLI